MVAEEEPRLSSIKSQLHHTRRQTGCSPTSGYRCCLPGSQTEFSDRSFHMSLSSSSQGQALSPSGSVYRKGSMRHLGAAPSVYGGAGGYGTRISVSRDVASYENDLATGGDLLGGNEKLAMQNLNDRLANYLEKVRSLEQSNTSLEVKIKQWYETNVPSTVRDYSPYYVQIKELQNQIKEAQTQNARCVLKIDNAKLAMEDFRLKFETERGARMVVESDLQGLNKVFDNLTLEKSDLEIQIEELNKDLALLKKEHHEEVEVLRQKLGKNVSVEVDAAPGLNLAEIMNEMRQKYEVLAQKNLQEAKEQFEKQIEALQQHVAVNTQELKGTEVHVTEVRRTYQNLMIDLQSQIGMKESLERTLEETKARYASHLAVIQRMLSSLEAQLMQVRADTERQNQEHNTLLDIKTLLEQEIATYRRLLEGEDVITTEYQLSTLETKDTKKTRKIKTVVEEVVDGKIVSSEVKEIEESM